MKVVKKLKQMKNDGWANILTGLGAKGKDKRLSAEAQYTLMSEGDAEELHASDEMAKKVVNMLPQDMLSEGFRVVSPDLEDDVLEASMDYLENLTLTKDGNKLVESLIWGRLYGGAGLVVGTGVDEDVREPLDIDRLPSLAHLTLLNRYELIPQGINGDPTSNNFSLPETYLIQPRVTGSVGISEVSAGSTKANKNALAFQNASLEIHHSRIIRFDGSRLARRIFIQNHYWHDSILNSLQDDIRDYQAAFASASALILDFAQAVYKVKNLADIVSSPDGLKTIQDRIAIIDISRSILRAAIVDADGEDFERKTTSLAGLDKTLDKLARKFTSATEYPHTVLMGESPSGLGASGESERNDYNKTVRGMQTQDLKPRLMELFRLIFAAGDGPTGGKIPAKYDIEFEPLKHLTQKEMIEARKQQAESDKIYIETGVVDSTEIALSRFGDGKYSFETEIDADLREAVDVELDQDRDTDPEPSAPVKQDNKGKGKRRKKRSNRSRAFTGARY